MISSLWPAGVRTVVAQRPSSVARWQRATRSQPLLLHTGAARSRGGTGRRPAGRVGGSARCVGGAVVLLALQSPAVLTQPRQAAPSGGPQPQQQQPCGADRGPAGQLG